MFAPGKLLPHLTSLETQIDAEDEAPIDEKVLNAEMTAADLASLARCCPKLASLKLENVPRREFEAVRPLHQLTGLTQLWLAQGVRNVFSDSDPDSDPDSYIGLDSDLYSDCSDWHSSDFESIASDMGFDSDFGSGSCLDLAGVTPGKG
jgi:hypothetical protein